MIVFRTKKHVDKYADANAVCQFVYKNENETDSKNVLYIYVDDSSLKIDNFTDDDIKKISSDTTRKQLLDDYKTGMVVLVYKYTYNISSKKVETAKNFYYTD